MIGAIALVLLLVIVAPALLDGTRESSSDRLSNARDDQDVRTEIIVLNEPRNPDALQAAKSAAEPLQPGVIVANRSAPAAKAEESDPAAVAAATQPETQSKTPAPTPALTSAKAQVASAAPTATPSTEVVNNELAVGSRPVAGDPEFSRDFPKKSEAIVAKADKVKAAGFAVQLGSFGQVANAQKYAAELSNKGFAAFIRSGSTATGGVHRVYAGPRPSRDAAQQLASVLGNAGYRGIVVDLSAGDGTH
jgi:DedD protein